MTRERVEPRSCNQGRPKNDAFIFSATVVEWIERLPLKRQTLVQFSIRSNQRLKKWYSPLSCLMFNSIGGNVKPPSCVQDRWAGGSLT